MKRALVVIDVQESFRQRENWAACSNPEIAKQVHRLTETFRERGEMIVWVLHTEPGTGNVFDPASGYVRLIEGLEAADGEPVITKTSFDAFHTTNLQQLLIGENIGEVVTCGIRTEQCVETTTRAAAGMGFEVTYVVDATATHPIELRRGGRWRRSSLTRARCRWRTSSPGPSTCSPAGSPGLPPLRS
jgi:nicotinamidase-related amidase